MLQPADTSLLHPPASSQPRKFDLLADSHPPATAMSASRAAQAKKDNLMRLEVGNYMNLPPVGPQPHHSRQNLTLFLFNPGRQDLISQLLNTLPVGPSQGQMMNPASGGQRGAAFPSYYMGHRDSVSGAVPMDPPTRLRGDSIFLPPPVSSKYTDSDTQMPVSANVPPGSLRLNSIFSSLIQIPGSTGNSVSGQSVKDSGKIDSRTRRSTTSTNEYYQDDDSINKDSLSNIFGWNQDKLSLSGQGAQSSGSKRNTKLFDTANSFWDAQNAGIFSLIAGIPNNELNAFLANLQHNGSIDFTNMSNEQRRDSILKLINTQQVQGKDASTKLREDIFDKHRASMLGPRANDRKPSIPEGGHFSPTSSMSLKSSHKFNDEPQSPKTSPSQMHVSTMNPNVAMSLQQQQQQRQQQLQQPPLQQYGNVGNSGIIQKQQPVPYYQNVSVPQQDAYQYGYQEGMAPYQQQGQAKKPDQYSFLAPSMPQGNQGGRMANPGYLMQAPTNSLPPIFKKRQFAPETDKGNYSYQLVQPTNNSQLGEPFEPNVDDKHLVSAQQYARSEDGRPLLGATKVDQLMLVIQAREKGNTNAIKQAADGSILATPNSGEKDGVLPLAVDLVGGIEKPSKDDDTDDDQGDKKKKRKGKTQQCPYCFKQFNQSTHLDVHVRSHIGYKPFQCTYCLKRFTQGGNLRTHMRLHTGEKPFTCSVCNRSFSRKGNLAAHMLTHNKEKPFECKLDGCDKSFTQLGNLKSHQNKFHLPTLNRLTQTLAELSGEELASLSDSQKELLEYFRNLYKNSNKGIRGRGKGKRVATVNEMGGDGAISASSSAHTSPQQETMQMHQSMQQISPHQSPSQLMNPNSGLAPGHVNFGLPEHQNY